MDDIQNLTLLWWSMKSKTFSVTLYVTVNIAMSVKARWKTQIQRTAWAKRIWWEIDKQGDWPIINLFQETKKCLDAGRGQSMDLLYVAPCQNIPSQVESSLSMWFKTSTRLWPPKTFACSRSGTSTTISTNTRSITCPHLPSSTMWYSQEALCTHVAR